MTYREILRLYQTGKLNAQEAKEVAEAIEKQEAISEYLFDQGDIPGLDDLGPEAGEGESVRTSGEGQSASPYSEEIFLKMIRKNIRRAFVKMGMAAAAVVLAAVLLVETVVPKMVDRFYYDPGKKIGRETNQLALDMSVFTELKVPDQYFRKEAVVEDRGYARYDIVLPQNFGYSGLNFHSVAGKIEKNRLTLYDVNTLMPINNYFGWYQAEDQTDRSLTEIMEEEKLRAEQNKEEGFFLRSFAGDRQQATETLEQLSEGQQYAGYVTLDRIIDYEEFLQLNEKEEFNAMWCAVMTGTDPGEFSNPLGMFVKSFYSDFKSWDDETFPHLQMYMEPEDKESITENYFDEVDAKYQDPEYMKTHFTSLLRYYGRQTEFRRMFDEKQDPITSEDYDGAAAYVQENGLRIYGFMVIADKQELLRINDVSGVYEVAVTALNR